MANLPYLTESEYVTRATRIRARLSPSRSGPSTRWTTSPPWPIGRRPVEGRVLCGDHPDPGWQTGPAAPPLSDASGDSAIFQYVGQAADLPRPQLSGDDQLADLDKQLALNDYWEEIGGLTMLPAPTARRTVLPAPPSTSRPCQRPTRPNEAVAGVMSVMRNVSVLDITPHLSACASQEGIPDTG